MKGFQKHPNLSTHLMKEHLDVKKKGIAYTIAIDARLEERVG